MYKKISGGKRTSYHVLGVPAFATAREIRAAYLKRIELLGAYRFDKASQPMEWRVVVDVLRELNEAYGELSSLFPNGQDATEANATADGAAFERAVSV